MKPACVGAMGCVVALLVGSLAPARAATVVWTLDSTAEIAGLPVEILGAPVVVTTPHGKAVAFDGVDDGLLLPVNPVAGWPQFTIEILFSVAREGGFEQRFLHVGLPNDDRALIELRLRTDGRWYLDTFLRSGGHERVLIDPEKLHPAAQWYWVAARYDGQQLAHFINGALELEGALAVPPLPEGKTSLGVRMTRRSWFKGTIREVRFHDSALAAERLQRLRP